MYSSRHPWSRSRWFSLWVVRRSFRVFAGFVLHSGWRNADRPTGEGVPRGPETILLVGNRLTFTPVCQRFGEVPQDTSTVPTGPSGCLLQTPLTATLHGTRSTALNSTPSEPHVFTSALCRSISERPMGKIGVDRSTHIVISADSVYSTTRHR